MSSVEIRQTFLDYFARKDHLVIPGSSIIPNNDPTLLYINSGMAPMKDYFLGTATPPRRRLVNVQPCIRTIDIEEVGDRHHLTFFEMMGSWSIDDYFKEGAVELAFELLTEGFGFPAARLYATVFAGDDDLGLPPDEVAAAAWEKVGFGRDHIVWLGREDNFWGPAGETGPCGPATEVFYDTGDDYGEPYVPGGHFDTESRYIEIWNAGVFMELNKQPDGSFTRLPFNSVDTGSGVERMALVLQGADSAYETDVLGPVVAATREQFAGGDVGERDIRIVADHIRSAGFILHEGVEPSNEGRGYIPRRLIRKAMAIAARAGVERVDWPLIIDAFIEPLAVAYPRLVETRSEVLEAFHREEADFGRAISRGLRVLERLIGEPPFEVGGEDAFDLFATYGMPLEVVSDFVHERGGTVDLSGYERAFRRHQEVSRPVPKGGVGAAAGLIGADDYPATEFTGYSGFADRGRVVGLVREGRPLERAAAGESVEVITDRTPFYAEGGGQVGDRGRMTDGHFSVVVETTVKTPHGHHLHSAVVEEGHLGIGDEAVLEVDVQRRLATTANHSATHLLYAALREVLGPHVTQAGSLVEPHRLRFDFTHKGALSTDELHRVELLVNRWIRENVARTTAEMPYGEAIAEGALAFDQDDYGDVVRVVAFGEWSKELCGGTHVERTGQIGLLRVVSEGAIAAGTRRVVALTGDAAMEYTLEREDILRRAAAELNTGVNQLVERVAALGKRGEKPAEEPRPPAMTKEEIDSLSRTAADGTRYLGSIVPYRGAQVREEASRAADVLGGLTCLLSVDEGKVRVAVVVAKGLDDRFDAGAIIRQLVPLVDGKGGGSRSLAEGGGSKPDGADELLRAFAALVESAAAGAPADSH